MQVSTKNGKQLQLKPHSGGLEKRQEKKILSTGEVLQNRPAHQIGWTENGSQVSIYMDSKTMAKGLAMRGENQKTEDGGIWDRGMWMDTCK